MATVISLTEEKIKELLAGWEGVALSQDEINALVLQLRTNQLTVSAEMEEIQNVTLVQFRADLAANSDQVSTLNDVVLPDLEAQLVVNDAAIEDLVTVTIPALQTDMASTASIVLESPYSYNTLEQPTNPDEDNRDLVVGDSWYDPSDDNKHYVWNGVEWSTLSVDVADFSLTAEKFKTSTHMIY